MGMFVISKRYNGDYKFIFATRKGKTIFTSIGCKQKSDCERMIAAIKDNITVFGFTKYKKAANKYFFRLSKDGLVLANSRKYSTELMLSKGIDEIIKHAPMAEILDFSENDFVFPDGDTVLDGTEAMD
ncbi:YegP family protein [Flavobacterium sp.]|uniref:YegP family protein n=2 Tax=Flavobacterium sp. TaxID=239 RepID=UPI002FDB693C